MSWYLDKSREIPEANAAEAVHGAMITSLSQSWAATVASTSGDLLVARMAALVRFFDEVALKWDLPCLFMASDHGAWAKLASKLPGGYCVPDVGLWRAMSEEQIVDPPELPRRRTGVF